jgi:uncharacterized protein YpmS
MKWFRRCIFAVIVLLFGAILLLAGGYILLRGQPDYYHGSTLTAEQQAAAAGSAEDKFRRILNSADLAHRDSALAAQATQPGTTHPATAASAINVTFTDDELNSVFQKWSELNNWKSTYSRYVSDPIVIFQRDRIIVAGRVQNNELNAVASVQFQPEVLPDGMMQLKLVRALAGRLPVPTAMFQKYLDRAVNALQQRLPQWQQGARIAPDGEANNDAIAAQLSKLAIAALHQQPADGVVFLPTAGKANVPVKVVGVTIQDHSIQLSLQPLDAPEREALLKRIKSPLGNELASSN